MPAVERTLDAPANRCILHMLRALQFRCRSLAARLGELARAQVSDTRTGVASRAGRWRQILGHMEREFTAAERRRPFSEARRPEVTAAGLNAVAAHPLYAQFWRGGIVMYQEDGSGTLVTYEDDWLISGRWGSDTDALLDIVFAKLRKDAKA